MNPAANGREEESVHLRDVVAHLLERIEEEGETVVEEACRTHPDLAESIRRRISTLRDLGLVGEDEPAVDREIPEHLGEFRLIERVGGGGMGVVYRAVQESLDRDVAIKLIRPDQLHLPHTRERFAREVSIVSGLKHPGIVPVYTVGEDQSLPYFAMEFVEGCTLEEALRELVDHDPRVLAGKTLARVVERLSRGRADEGEVAYLFEGSWETTALRIVQRVADALAYAHRHDVLHRDVKPSNVMITPDGKVMLFDFGLSRAEDSSELTRSTTRLGSLPYLPPEQLDENQPSFTPKSDVYSLGVLLYQLLTLRLPFKGGTGPELYLKVLEAAPKSVRTLNPSVSWEAETVCRAAMERDPARRYVGAEEFARDLQNVLDRQPLIAKRAGVLLRLRRWSQRNPGLAVALVVGTVLTALGLTALFRQQQQHLAQMGVALAETEAERGRAVANLELALDAVDRMLAEVGEERLANVPQMEGVRGELLTSAIELYEELLASNPGDERLEFLFARMHREKADVLGLLGRNDEAVEAYHTHIAAARERLATQPDDDRVLLDLGESLASLGFLYMERGQLDEAAELYGESRAANTEAFRLTGSQEARANAAAADHFLAQLAIRQGDLAEALELARGSVAELESVLAEAPDDEVREMLGLAKHAEAQVLLLLEDFVGSEAAYVRAVELLEACLAADPESTKLAHFLGNTLQRLGWTRINAGKPLAAIATLRRAVEVDERLLERHPGEVRHRVDTANARTTLAIALWRAGELTEARSNLERALVLLEELIATSGDFVVHRASLGATLTNYSNVLFELGESEEALRQAARAVAIHQEIFEANPENPEHRGQLASAKMALAQKFLFGGLHAEGVREIELVPELLPGSAAAYRDMAATYQAAAYTAREDPRLSPEEGELVAKDYLWLGREALLRARECGRGVQQILSDPDVALVRALPGFEEALRAVRPRLED